MDTTTYDKAKKYKPGRGYEPRIAAPTSIVVHSTSNPNHTNTAFEAEADFLYTAPLVGAHYLVGKDGTVVRFFDPLKWAAWHAGRARAEYSNQRSIGIELHHSVGDPPYPQAQIAALGSLLSSLSALFNIPFGMVETHGQIALAGPYDRKKDPSDWPHADFIRWRFALMQDTSPPPVSLPTDKFARWGSIGKPSGGAVDFAIPKAWLVNQALGACVVPERTSDSKQYAIAEFERGIIIYYVARKAALVEMF